MSESYTFEGQVIAIQNVEEISDKFRKQTIVVSDVDSKYPQEVPFEFVNDNIDKLNNVRSGDMVVVGFNLQGREWKGRYFASNRGWKIDVNKSAAPQQNDSIEESVEDTEDVPF